MGREVFQAGGDVVGQDFHSTGWTGCEASFRCDYQPEAIFWLWCHHQQSCCSEFWSLPWSGHRGSSRWDADSHPALRLPVPGQQPSLFRPPVQSLMFSPPVREIWVQHLTVKLTSSLLPVPWMMRTTGTSHQRCPQGWGWPGTYWGGQL